MPLIPDWKEKGAPITVPVREDNFYVLGEAGQAKVPNWPMPKLMSNHGNYIVSMANVCRWMAEQAEALGVEIFPGMSCSEVVWGEDGRVAGVVAGEFGTRGRWHAGPELRGGDGAAGQICPAGRRRARLTVQTGDGEIRAVEGPLPRRNSASA